MGDMRDKAQRPGIGREEQVRETSGRGRPTRARTKEEGTRRQTDEPARREGRDEDEESDRGRPER
ncbi:MULTISPECIES: hypothetical protein [unclassified Streptomyces]|uniref:hypothetical protein n=1 Tax=unclassified Streptomyces TaxID=2593676 RepID=UPI002E1180A9|nr:MULTISPECIES: hypothetical protein [unclassified Streptomyces]WSR23059.1 hypothetical protein OG573_30630 [Streptomyces sp. NBC_01205]